MLGQLEGCCRCIDGIFVPSYGFFEVLITKICLGGLTADGGENGVGDIDCLDVSLVNGNGGGMDADICGKTEEFGFGAASVLCFDGGIPSIVESGIFAG